MFCSFFLLFSRKAVFFFYCLFWFIFDRVAKNVKNQIPSTSCQTNLRIVLRSFSFTIKERPRRSIYTDYFNAKYNSHTQTHSKERIIDHHHHHGRRRPQQNRLQRRQRMKFETSKEVNITSTFDGMGIREDLLRGLYAYGFEKPSAIQQRAVLPITSGREMSSRKRNRAPGKRARFPCPCVKWSI